MPHQAISEAQKKALRAWFRQQYPKPRQHDCIPWFQSHFNQQLRPSTVSDILSNQYLYLDDDRSVPSDIYRQRHANWPILEDILYHWQQGIEARNGLLTGDILLEKARQIWPQIPDYQDSPTPEFSVGWLNNFKRRYNIRMRKQHGEVPSVNHSATEEMKAIQTIAGEYDEENIFNMDETGLFWRQAPTSGLGTQSRPGQKREKARITLTVCVNSTGSERLPIWIIGTAKMPRSLHGINIQALGGVWHSNKKAWMTTFIMSEWLHSFYSYIGLSRPVLLLLDNFSAHIQGVNITPPPANIKIQWLPANSTSVYQPLDQGIIMNLKTYYRKTWLHFIIERYEHQQDPTTLITLYDAVRWVLHAWRYNISNTTIYSCFRKSQVIQPQISLPTEPVPDLTSLYQETQQAGHIKDMMSLSNFINPPGEDAEPAEESESLESIISQHVHPQIDGDSDHDGPAAPPPPSLKAAIDGLRMVLQYQEHSQETCLDEIKQLEQLERRLLYKAVSLKQQQTLDQWFI